MRKSAHKARDWLDHQKSQLGPNRPQQRIGPNRLFDKIRTQPTFWTNYRIRKSRHTVKAIIPSLNEKIQIPVDVKLFTYNYKTPLKKSLMFIFSLLLSFLKTFSTDRLYRIEIKQGICSTYRMCSWPCLRLHHWSVTLKKIVTQGRPFLLTNLTMSANIRISQFNDDCQKWFN